MDNLALLAVLQELRKEASSARDEKHEMKQLGREDMHEYYAGKQAAYDHALSLLVAASESSDERAKQTA